MISFINSFLSYLLVFVIIVALAVIGAIIGVKWAKASNAKKEAQQAAEAPAPEASTEE